MVTFDTPEAALEAFANAWKRRDWAGMVETCQTSRRIRGSASSDRLRDLFGSFRLRSFAIGTSARASEPATGTTEAGRTLALRPEAVDVELAIRYDHGKRGVLAGTRVVRVIREDEAGMPLLVPEGGSWGVNETSALRGIEPVTIRRNG